jgi:hypothetical protein
MKGGHKKREIVELIGLLPVFQERTTTREAKKDLTGETFHRRNGQCLVSDTIGEVT